MRPFTIECSVGGHTSFLQTQHGPEVSFLLKERGDTEVCETRRVLNTRPQRELAVQQFSAFV